MASPNGFLTFNRKTPSTRNVEDRVKDYKEIYIPVDESLIIEQSSRCMDCGVPFCHSGCPLGNLIPDFNDAVYNQNWKKAYDILSETNNFPEFTGRICPAPCESACVLGIKNLPVTIENIEKQIIEHAFANRWVNANNFRVESGKTIAIIGSGPAGLAAAEQLCKAGHRVSVYERNEKPGGLLRYGIPDFKLEKWVVDRRVRTMKEAGINFICNTEVGFNIDIKEIEVAFDAILLCGGSTIPRDLNIPGRNASGIYFAMDFLEQSNKFVDGGFKTLPAVYVRNKKVVVIGGGDTGADCVGTSHRQGAASVTQLELLSKPGNKRTDKDPWPLWPMTLRTSSSYEEGCHRLWSVHTKRFIKNKSETLTGIEVVDIAWKINEGTGNYNFVEVADTARIIECDIILIAAGFLHPQRDWIIEPLGITTDHRGNVATQHYQTNIPHVFAAGDMRRGQSLVVWAIHEGREAAVAVDQFLSGKSALPGKSTNILDIA